MNTLLFLILGLAAGVVSGLLGIGGGVLIVPCLVFIAGLSQHTAQGTTLALMVPPIGLLAAWTYYRQGHVDVRIAALICLRQKPCPLGLPSGSLTSKGNTSGVTKIRVL